MIAALKTLARGLGLDSGNIYRSLSLASLRAAAREQNLDDLIVKLRSAVPDLSDQYTDGPDTAQLEAYWEPKMRGLHAFQVRLALDALSHAGTPGATIVDIGDSSGAHSAYIKAVAAPGAVARFVSVNLDPVAVEKVKSRGGEAVLCRAEELDHQSIRPDLYLSFETLEHLTDPVSFLHGLSSKGAGRLAAVTVPYRRDSRFGGALIRRPQQALPAKMTAEQVHIFEFSPADWQLLARFAGWRTVDARVYRQYPLRHPLRAMAPLWRALDFEGFLGLILERDSSLSDRYRDW